MYFQFSILKHTIIYPQTCCPYIRFLKFKYIHDTNVFDEIVTNRIHVIFANQSQLLVLFKQKLIATESCIAIYLEYFDRRRYLFRKLFFECWTFPFYVFSTIQNRNLSQEKPCLLASTKCFWCNGIFSFIPSDWSQVCRQIIVEFIISLVWNYTMKILIFFTWQF